LTKDVLESIEENGCYVEDDWGVCLGQFG
jgi:hypothetical protein